MSNPNPPAPVDRAPRWFVVLGLAALAAYAVFLAANGTTVAGGSDSSGYLNSARLFAEGQLQTELRVPAEFGAVAENDRVRFTPLGFFPHPNNPHLPPTYPPGLPLHFSAASKVFGWAAGPWIVEIGAALAAVWLCYRVAREFRLDWPLAAAGALSLAVSPVFLFASIQPLSDTLATAWCLAAVLAAMRARQNSRWATAGGIAFAIAVLVRPTNVVLLPALLVLIGFNWRRLVIFGLAGLPFAVWIAYYNHTLYGAAMKSGYGDWKLAFKISYFLPTAAHFGRWLFLLLPGALLIMAIATVALRRVHSRGLLALALWFGAITGVYACYEVSHEVWWCLRFILPAMPALIIAGLLGIAALSERWAGTRSRHVRLAMAAVLAAWAFAASWYWTAKFGVRLIKLYENVYAEAALSSRAQVPPNALVVGLYMSGAIYYYMDNPVLRWDQVQAPEFARYASLARAAGRPVFALIFDAEEKPVLQERCPGEWTRIGGVRNIGLWRLASAPP
ncbi:MAG TPA: glycosyltransferase family 39 protein [Opitutaceae bacterium]|nr:glycosyltransferase family 39 protein [Opitutaceae bacterium]